MYEKFKELDGTHPGEKLVLMVLLTIVLATGRRAVSFISISRSPRRWN